MNDTLENPVEEPITVPLSLKEPVSDTVIETVSVITPVEEPITVPIKEPITEPVEEPITAPVEESVCVLSNTNVNVEMPSLIQLLTSITAPGTSISKYNIPIDEPVKQVLLALIKEYPTYFSDVELILINITQDNKINTADIPNIIILLQKLYILMVDLKSIKVNMVNSSETCGAIIKIIIHVLVEDNIVPITADKKEVFLANVDKLVDSCVDLLKFTTQLKPKSCLSFLHF